MSLEQEDDLDLWLDAQRDRTARNKGLCSAGWCYAARSLFIYPRLAEKTNANYVTALLPSSRRAHAFLPRFHADSHWHKHQKNRPIPASSIYRTLSLSRSCLAAKGVVWVHIWQRALVYATYVSRPLGNIVPPS